MTDNIAASVLETIYSVGIFGAIFLAIIILYILLVYTLELLASSDRAGRVMSIILITLVILLCIVMPIVAGIAWIIFGGSSG